MSAAPTQVPARPAATVVLLRDGAEGVEVWLMLRVRGMAFAGGMTVFPGGRVDEADADIGVPMTGGDVAALAARQGEPVEVTRAALVAAARETFEETGVLLTRPVVEADVGELRHRVETRQVSFADALRQLDAAIDLSLLHAWARWVTPVDEPRRYDTHFCLAQLPFGAVVSADTPEAAAASWVPITRAVAEAEAGERLMLPPTLAVLRGLAQYPSVADALADADRRSLEPVMPVIRRSGAGLVAVLPDGTELTLPTLTP